jgi:hypothetical protein
VESTARDATFRDYRCIVLRDCTTELIAADAPRSNQEASLLAIELLFGWTAAPDAVIDTLTDRHAAAKQNRLLIRCIDEFLASMSVHGAQPKSMLTSSASAVGR